MLGASSGFGEACSLALARAGWNIFGVHLDRKGTQPNVDRIVAEIASAGRKAEYFNVNAADDARRAEVVAAIAKTCGGEPPESRVSVLLHSLAFGTLKPMFAESREASLTQAPDRDDARRDGQLARLLDAGPRLFATSSRRAGASSP